MAAIHPQGFLSFAEQTLHYFDRPHEKGVSGVVASPAAWVGSELAPIERLAYRLTDEDLHELEAALMTARNLDRPTSRLRAEDFPLPSVAARIAEWRETLAHGLGFQVIRGLPVERWSERDCELVFWCLGLHLGRPGAQNRAGDLLGHVRDSGAAAEDPMVRLYQTPANIDYHCDAADVVGLLCLKKAKSGGASRIVSSVTVFNELVLRHPELVERLFEPFWLDVREEGSADGGRAFPVPPCRYANGMLRTFYHADYFRSATRHADVPDLAPGERDLLDTYEAIASEPGIYLDMDLEPGDIQLLSNHTNLHARTSYVDHDDPTERRHLLRLWLSL